MKTSSTFILPVLFFLCVQFSALSQNGKKPDYAGLIEYTKGGFGGFNYPEKGDSVYVFLKDENQINVIVFPATEKTKTVRDLKTIVMSDLKLNKKKVYDEMVSPTKFVHTSSFDMKFMTQGGGSDGATYGVVSLTHYGKGDIADLNLIVEKEGLQIYDMLVAKVTKLK